MCSQCQRGLSGGEEGGFHYEEANLFCTQCFTNSYGVQCFGCKQMIGGNELWVEAMEQNWHPECFVCTVSISIVGRTILLSVITCRYAGSRWRASHSL